jgi:hypothetical protein
MIPVGILQAGNNPKYTFLSYSGNVQLASGVNSATANNVSIGTASVDRIVVVTTSFRSGAYNQNTKVTSVTCGGTSMTPIVTPYGTLTNSNIWYLLVPTGSTANFVVTLETISGDNRAGYVSFATISGYQSGTPAIINSNSVGSKLQTVLENDIVITNQVCSVPSSGYTYSTSNLDLNVKYNANLQTASDGRYGVHLVAGKVIGAADAGSIRVTTSYIAFGSNEMFMYAIWR